MSLTYQPEPMQPLPQAPNADALAGYQKLLRLCRDNDVGFLGMGCVHESFAQELLPLQPDVMRAGKAVGVSAITLEQDFHFTEAMAEVMAQRAGGATEADVRRRMGMMAATGYRSYYRSFAHGATPSSLREFGAFMAGAFIQADAQGIPIAGLEDEQAQLRAGAAYFDIGTPEAPNRPTSADLKDLIRTAQTFRDIQQLRELTGLRGDRPSAEEVARLLNAQKTAGNDSPFAVGTVGAFHLSLPPSLDTLLPEYGVRTAKVLTAAKADELPVLLGYYNTEAELTGLPVMVFCFEDGQCYDRKTGQIVEPTAALLCIQGPTGNAVPGPRIDAPYVPPAPPPTDTPAHLQGAVRAAPAKAAPIKAGPLPPPPGSQGG